MIRTFFETTCARQKIIQHIYALWPNALRIFVINSIFFYCCWEFNYYLSSERSITSLWVARRPWNFIFLTKYNFMIYGHFLPHSKLLNTLMDVYFIFIRNKSSLTSLFTYQWGKKMYTHNDCFTTNIGCCRQKLKPKNKTHFWNDVERYHESFGWGCCCCYSLCCWNTEMINSKITFNDFQLTKDIFLLLYFILFLNV
jgi:hypothetical protein